MLTHCQQQSEAVATGAKLCNARMREEQNTRTHTHQHQHQCYRNAKNHQKRAGNKYAIASEQHGTIPAVYLQSIMKTRAKC